MGNLSSLPLSSAGQSTNITDELTNMQLVSTASLSNTRFTDTYLCKNTTTNSLHVIKVFKKPPQTLFNPAPYIAKLEYENESCSDLPNIFSGYSTFDGEYCIYRVRPYFHSTLKQRLSPADFTPLTFDTKLWIAYQLIASLAQLHSKGFAHGDIKSENVLLTNWGWLLLTDSASFKPTFIDATNSTDFHFYFGTSSARICTIAPERFVLESTMNKIAETKLLESMDIFSLGCVLAELFSDASPLFTLKTLLNYKRGLFDPYSKLSCIASSPIKDMIAKMININPEKRPTSSELLNDLHAFPAYLGQILHPAMCVLSINSTEPGSDEPDALISMLYHMYPDLVMQIENCLSPGHSYHAFYLVLLKFVCVQITKCKKTQSLVEGLDLMLRMGISADNHTKLSLALPSISALITCSNSIIRGYAVESLKVVVDSVDCISEYNGDFFQECLFPKIKKLANDKNVFVRIKYAECISTLATTGQRFLLQSERLAIEKGLDIDSVHNTMSLALKELQEFIQDNVIILIKDKEHGVKAIIMNYIGNLCQFFGRQKTIDVILHHMITFYGHTDINLRISFFQNIDSVGTYIGGAYFEDIVLPSIVQCLYDVEESVTREVVQSLITAVKLKLITNSKIREICSPIIPLLLHPNSDIVTAAIEFVSIIFERITYIEFVCFIYPMLKQFLRTEIPDVNVINMRIALKTPIQPSKFEEIIKSLTELNKLVKKSVFESLFARSDISNEEKENILTLRNFMFQVAQSRLNLPKVKDELDLKNVGNEIIPHTFFLNMPSEYQNTIDLFASKHLIFKDTDSMRGTRSPMLRPGITNNQQNFDRMSSMHSLLSNSSAILTPAKFMIDTLDSESTLKAYLYKKAYELFPKPLPEIGHFIPDFEFKPTFDSIKIDGILDLTRQSMREWEPQGTLLSEFKEHKRSINGLALSPDHLFFVSVSDDGTTRVWDTQRIERNPVNKSRLVMSHQGGLITSVTFCSNSYTIITSSTNGSIFVTRIDAHLSGGALVYKGYETFLELALDSGDYATKVMHYDTDMHSVLLYCTIGGSVNAHELRTNTKLWSFNLPSEYGYISSACYSERHKFIAVGTNFGIIYVWDMKCKALINVWQHPLEKKIIQLEVFAQEHSHHRETKLISVSVECSSSEVSIWDIEKAQCTTAWCLIKSPKDPDLSCSSTGIGQELKSTYADGLQAKQPITAFTLKKLDELILSIEESKKGTHLVKTGIQRVCCGGFQHGHMITASSDGCIRYWNPLDVEKTKNWTCCNQESTQVYRYGGYHHSNIQFSMEYGDPLPPPTTKENKQLTISIKKCVFTDILMCYSPFPMLLTSDRDGIIRVWK